MSMSATDQTRSGNALPDFPAAGTSFSYDEIPGSDLPPPSLLKSARLVRRNRAGSKRSLRVAQIAPLSEAVPPRLYGGTERIVAHLADALVDLGHEVFL